MRRRHAGLLAGFGIVASVAAAAFAGNESCSSTGTTACSTVTNSSSGIGVSGVSKSGTGLRGTSTDNNGAKGTSSSYYGVYGQSSTGPAAVFGTMTTGTGVLGTNTGSGGTGVMGTSVDGTGVYGTSVGTNGTTSGAGVFGSSSSGTGVLALTATGSTSAIALEGSSTAEGSGAGAYSSSGIGIVAQAAGGFGVIAYADTPDDPAISAQAPGDNGSDISGTYIGMIGRVSGSGGYPLYLYDSNSDPLFYVDAGGNVAAKGSVSSFARTRDGKLANAFVPTMTENAVEDTGSAQLSGGRAVVDVDKTFAATIDTTHAYRVFIDANGDANALYVTSKTPGSFEVRESKGGRSSIAFDYRIIATALGHAGERMALTSMPKRAAAPRVSVRGPHGSLFSGAHR